MAYMIVKDQCTSCSACEPECPNEAISETDDGVYAIDPAKCKECEGEAVSPRCAAICPVDDTCVPAV